MTRVRHSAGSEKKKPRLKGGESRKTPRSQEPPRTPPSIAGPSRAVQLWPEAHGPSVFDPLPDSALSRVLFLAALRRGWTTQQPCSSTSQLDSAVDEPDVQPALLVRLSHVSQRFRRLALDGSLWRRVAMGEGTREAAAAGVAALPESARDAVRSLHVKSYAGGPAGLQALYGAFAERLESLDLFVDASVPPDALAGFERLACLRALYLGTDDEAPGDRPAAFASAEVQGALSRVSLLPRLQSLELNALPLASAALAALPALAPTLTALDVPLYRDEDEPLPDAIAALCSLSRLQRLRVSFRHSRISTVVIPPASSEDLLPLASALPDLRAFGFGARLSSLDVVPALPRIEELSLLVGEVSDYEPLAAAADTLRSLSLRQDGPPSEACEAIADVLPRLTRLEGLELHVAAPAHRALASRSLALPRLREASLGCWPREEPVPGPILSRLATDVPSLRSLALESPPPLPDDLVALSRLNDGGLKSLLVAYEAAEGLRRPARRVLEAALPDVEVSFEEAAVVHVE